MLFRPSLFVNRLIVFLRGLPVYDQRFSIGVNIIRGENGSGKSTIADLLFHALGGEVSQWREEAKRCDATVAEVQINGAVATFSRNIDDGTRRRPISIFWGPLEKAIKSGPSEWTIYPFAAYSGKMSFSQVIFNELGIPEVRGELTSRITMHQILRMAYVDQFTPYNRLFRDEDFDSAVMREAVGKLLCGVYDDRLYNAIAELRNAESEVAAVSRQLKDVFAILGTSDQAVSVEFYREEHSRNQQLRRDLYDRLEQLSSEDNASEPVIDEIDKDRQSLRKELNMGEEQVLDLRKHVHEKVLGCL